jgi:HK97 family phage portal protein
MANYISDIQQEAEDIIGAVAPVGIPGFMRVLPAQQIEVVVDDDGNVLRYIQWKSNGKKATFECDEVIHMLHPHAQDPRYGESPLKSLATVVTTDLLVDKRQKKILLNDIALEWFINLPNVAEEEAKRVYEQFIAQYKSENSTFNGIVNTSPDFKIENISKSKDGDFLALGKDHMETIAMCLGVPLSVLGSSAGTSMNGAGSDNHLRNFIENTVRPISNKVETHLNRDCISAFLNHGLDYSLKLVLEDADDAAARIEMQGNAVKFGLKTINEIREEENKPPLEGGDKAFILAGNAIIPIDQIGVSVLPPAVVAPPMDSNVDDQPLNEAKDALKKAIRVLRKAL